MSSSKGPNLRYVSVEDIVPCCEIIVYASNISVFVYRRLYLDKPVCVHLNKNRKVSGTLRGYDQFMNIVLDGASDTTTSSDENSIGMVVIRGNSIVQFELLR
jgi:small nuclear ribonucleoprotein G